MNLNLRDLEYFIAVSEHRHFGKAAQVVHVSQPTLSMQLKKLEEQLGGRLIERLPGDARLTAFGEEVLPLAREILRLTHELGAHVSKKEQKTRLRLGIIPTISPYLLPRISRGMKHSLPEVRILLQEAYTTELVRAVRNGTIDVAILSTPIKEPVLKEVEIYSEPFYLAVSNAHRFAKRKSIQLKDLEQEKLLLLGEGHCLRRQALSLCNLSRTDEDADLSATSIETLRSMVGMGAGVTLIPQLAIRRGDRISYIPLADNSTYRSVGIIYRPSFEPYSVIQRLVDVIKEAANKEGLSTGR